jgi:polysaccharide biosynthesis protein PslJ
MTDTLQTAKPRTTRRRVFDVVSALTVYLVLVLGIPSNLVFEPLGAAGTPASVFRLLLFVWWCSGWVLPKSGLAKGYQPMRIAAWIFGASVLSAFAVAGLRPLSSIEGPSADRALLYYVGLLGLLLITADGIRDRERFDTFLRRLTIGGGLISVVAILQFFFGIDFRPWLSPPGLVVNAAMPLFFEGHIRRVAGTAGHPIELGVTLAMLIPLAVHYGYYSPRGKKLRGWAPALLIAVALPMAISRSAVLGLFAGAIVMIAGWNWQRIRTVLLVIPVFLVAVRGAIPGLLGTITAGFLGAKSDPSIKGRTEDYAFIGIFIKQRPWFGRGLGTFNPKEYRILDNQYLGTIIEHGFFGLACLILLLLIGIFTARGARRMSTDERTRDLGQMLAASIVVAATALFTFDAFSFPLFTGVLFLILGACGALWRFSREQAGLSPPPPRGPHGLP